MSLVKRISKSEQVRGLLCWLGSLYIRLVWLTGRWTVVNGHVPSRLWDEGKPFIFAHWHGRLLMMPYSWRHPVPIHMLISQHRDGLIIARTVAHFGIHTIAGSTSRGGTAALRAMLKALKGGECVGITPDGPRGPRMRASAGVANVAKLSGAPVVCCAYATRRHKLLRSWDRFMVALPFSRGVFVWSDPIAVPKGASEEEMDAHRLAIENALTVVTQEADRLMGLTPVQPADRP